MVSGFSLIPRLFSFTEERVGIQVVYFCYVIYNDHAHFETIVMYILSATHNGFGKGHEKSSRKCWYTLYIYKVETL